MPFRRPVERLAADRLASESQSDSNDLELPDDLGCLAEQLLADADRLADVYPARAPEMWLAASEGHNAWMRRAATVRWRIAAAVVLVAGGLASWGWLNRVGQHQQATVKAPVASKAATAEENSSVAGDERPTPTAEIPAGLFQSLSAPEQEALLDLMEREGIEQSSLSI